MKGFVERFNINSFSGWISLPESESEYVYYRINDDDPVKLPTKLGVRKDLINANIVHHVFELGCFKEFLNQPLEITLLFKGKNILGTPISIETREKELGKVLIGNDGWLFLDKDSNNHLSYILDGNEIDSSVLISWQKETLIRKSKCKELGIKMVSLVVPEKTYLYSEFLPIIPKDKSKILPTFEKKNLLCEYLIPKFGHNVDGFQANQEFYYKGDTHWNYYGAYQAYLDIIFHLGLSDELVSFSDGFRVKSHYMKGDLVSKLNSVNVEKVDYICPIEINYKLVCKNELHTTGRYEEYENVNSVNESKVLIFHTSSIDWMKPYILSHFRNVILVWSKNFDWNIIEDINPDIVIYQTNERFLYTPPAISDENYFSDMNSLSDKFDMIHDGIKELLCRKIEMSEKINVLIEEPALNTTKKSLIKSFVSNELFNVRVLSHNNSNKAVDYYSSFPVDTIWGGDFNDVCERYDIDIAFISNPHKTFEGLRSTYDFYKLIEDRVTYNTLLAYVPYAFLCMKDPHAFNDTVHRYAWKFYLETDYHESLLSHDIDRVSNYKVVGHPYLDVYMDFKRVSSLGKRILWCPHHNPNFYNDLKLKAQSQVILDYLNLNDAELIFRPHPNLFMSLYSSVHVNSESYKTLLSREEADELKRVLENHPKVTCDYNSPIKDLFELSDLIITNCGGFQMEALCTGIPIINTINKDLLSDYMVGFSHLYDFADEANQLAELIKNNLAECSNVRKRYELFDSIGNVGTAGFNIVRDVEFSLKGTL